MNEQDRSGLMEKYKQEDEGDKIFEELTGGCIKMMVVFFLGVIGVIIALAIAT